MKETEPLTKAERTSQFILKKVAPIFNRKGYVGTSMADVTAATGLTKGAIYGNFESKEKLALEAFNYNFRWIVTQLNQCVMEKESATDKLKALTDYYRAYYAHVIDYGGCPIVNISVDAHYQNPLLFERVKLIMERMISRMADIILMGIQRGEFRKDVDADKYARLIFGQIEGGIFTSVMSEDPSCLNFILDHIDQMVNNELRK